MYLLEVIVVAVLTIGTVAKVCSPVTPGNVDPLPRSKSEKDLVMSSGFLQGVDAARKLHYWFIESETDTSSAPLIIWINGGAGCSSIRNVIFDNGPFRVDEETLVDNEYAWSTVANMLYIDTVVGVGYSHSSESHLWLNDNNVLEDTLSAITHFFRKNNPLSKNEVYIAGSYQAAYNIIKVSSYLEKNTDINFKGLAIGNGHYNMQLEFNSKLYFGQGRSVWDAKGAKELLKLCCPHSKPDACDFFTNQMNYDCFNKSGTYLNMMKSMNQYNFYAPCFENNYENDCLDDVDMQNYLSDYAVKSSLNVEENPMHYSSCNQEVENTFIYRSHSLVQDINELKKKYKVLLYAGDKSIHGNHRQTEAFFDSLDVTQVSERTPWVYTDGDKCKQIGAFTKRSQNVKFFQIRGAGSLVSRDQPAVALQMIKDFLLN